MNYEFENHELHGIIKGSTTSTEMSQRMRRTKQSILLILKMSTLLLVSAFISAISGCNAPSNYSPISHHGEVKAWTFMAYAERTADGIYTVTPVNDNTYWSAKLESGRTYNELISNYAETGAILETDPSLVGKDLRSLPPDTVILTYITPDGERIELLTAGYMDVIFEELGIGKP